MKKKHEHDYLSRLFSTAYLRTPMDIRQNKLSDKAIGIWLMTGVLMLVIQILLGGITRLTGSGLSITKWDVITGTLPPINALQWQDAFNNYRHTTQYRLLHSGFSLHEFKAIYFWEWFHRLWGRLIGIAFFIPFLVFLFKRSFRREMIHPMAILFLFGAMQGAVGWIMVASGLTGDAIYVEPVKLAMHFLLACVLISYTFWFGLKLMAPTPAFIYPTSVKKFTLFLILLLFVQLVFGAIMAGNKAAAAAPTWPDINGSFIPPSVFTPADGWKSLVENPIVIHFVHRCLAYIIFLSTSIWFVRAFRIPYTKSLRTIMILPMGLVLLQVCLGVFTVLTSTKIKPAQWNMFEWMAQLHQLVAICLLLSFIASYYFMTRQKINSKLSIDPQPI